MIELKRDGDGILLPILAQPKARRNAVTGIHDGRLKVAVMQAPEKGKANAAIVKLLAKSLGLKRSQLELIAGATAQRKTIRVAGVSAESLSETIAAFLGTG